MYGCTTNKRVASVDPCETFIFVWRTTNDERSVVYRGVSDGSGVEDLGAEAAGGTIEGEGSISKWETVAAIKTARLGAGPRY
jgi:hypothetical protein